MAATLDIDYADDDIPWCGLFVGHCIATALGDEPIPSNPLGAKNWRHFGMPCDPQLGCVLVFYRGQKDGWQGHVGFYFAEDVNYYHVLGGNQSNSVNLMRVDRIRLIASRWPVTAGLPEGRRNLGTAEAPVSNNEE
ncbi:TIGR02594 family protein [Roseivivax sp. CAU 1761]